MMNIQELRSKVWALMQQLEAQERRHTPAEWYRGGMNACMTILGWLPEPPKPCPFCGNSEITVCGDNMDYPGQYAYECQTDDCCRGPWRSTERTALAAWNTRKEA